MKVKLALQTLEESRVQTDTEYEQVKLERCFVAPAAEKALGNKPKKFLRLLMGFCFLASLVALQFDYGLPKAIFILSSLVTSVFGLNWSVNELKKIIDARKKF